MQEAFLGDGNLPRNNSLTCVEPDLHQKGELLQHNVSYILPDSCNALVCYV